MEHNVENLKILSLAYHSFQVLRELQLQAVRVMEISYIEEAESTIEWLSYCYQVESDSHCCSYQTHLDSVDEYALNNVEDKPYRRQKDFLQTLKATFESS